MNDLLADIAAQSDALREHNAVFEEAHEAAIGWAAADRQVVMTGMATSLYAWHSAGLLLSHLKNTPLVVDTSEYLGSREPSDDRPILVMSRSGESVEIARLANETPAQNLVAITEGRGSVLAQRASRVIAYDANERSFCNTKSFVLSMAAALAIAAGLGGRDSLSPQRWVAQAAALAEETATRPMPELPAVARLITGSSVTMLLARGHQIGVANQAALDLQEIGRIAALPVGGGLFRHGPMELILRPRSVFVALVANDAAVASMTRVVKDIGAAGGQVIAIAADGVELPDSLHATRLPSSAPHLAPIAFAIALQRLNVEIARQLEIHTIQPRLIERVTTTE